MVILFCPGYFLAMLAMLHVQNYMSFGCKKDCSHPLYILTKTGRNVPNSKPTGETGWNLSTRLTEHKRATRTGDVNNHIAEHHLKTKHQIDWDSATCITYSTDYYQRFTLESWFTNLEQTLLNRGQQLPASYKRLIDETSKTKYERMTGELTIWLIIDGSKRSNCWLRVFMANNITA